MGERVDETEKEKADHEGEDSSDGTIPTSKLVTRSRSETDIVHSIIGDDANEKDASDADETVVKVRKRRTSEGSSAKPPNAEFLADVVANEEEAIGKTWRKMEL